MYICMLTFKGIGGALQAHDLRPDHQPGPKPTWNVNDSNKWLIRERVGSLPTSRNVFQVRETIVKHRAPSAPQYAAWCFSTHVELRCQASATVTTVSSKVK